MFFQSMCISLWWNLNPHESWSGLNDTCSLWRLALITIGNYSCNKQFKVTYQKKKQVIRSNCHDSQFVLCMFDQTCHAAFTILHFTWPLVKPFNNLKNYKIVPILFFSFFFFICASIFLEYGIKKHSMNEILHSLRIHSRV